MSPTLPSKEIAMPSHAKPTKAEIIALETSYWDAMKAKDGDKAAALSGQTSLVTGAQGVMTINRDKMGKMTETGDWTLESYSFDDVEVSTPAPDVAIIAYTVRQKVKMGGKSQELRAADSSTWIRGADGWACHAHSEAFLKDGAAA
jgi:ketosteroid isomerase-like protein